MTTLQSGPEIEKNPIFDDYHKKVFVLRINLLNLFAVFFDGAIYVERLFLGFLGDSVDDCQDNRDKPFCKTFNCCVLNMLC